MIVDFRPHTMKIITVSGYYNNNGDWIVSGETESDPIPCRYEPNGRAGTLSLPDGTIYRYSYTIYLCVDTSLRIKYGDTVELTSQDGIVIGRFEVKGFHRGQLDMKVWV